MIETLICRLNPSGSIYTHVTDEYQIYNIEKRALCADIVPWLLKLNSKPEYIKLEVSEFVVYDPSAYVNFFPQSFSVSLPHSMFPNQKRTLFIYLSEYIQNKLWLSEGDRLYYRITALDRFPDDLCTTKAMLVNS